MELANLLFIEFNNHSGKYRREKVWRNRVFFIIIQCRFGCLQRNLSIFSNHIYSIHNVHIYYKAICTADIKVRNQTFLSCVPLNIHNFVEWFCYKFWSKLGLIHNPKTAA
jgi:hypothetical protein